jgi:hypothetical protein
VFDNGTWKLWVAVSACALVVGLAVHRGLAAFDPGPPDWLHVGDHQSQHIPDLRGLNSAWYRFHYLLQTTQSTALTRGLDEYSTQFIEFERNGTDAIVWSGETVRNHGFEPRTRIECELWVDAPQLLGFYASDGTPLAFTTYKNPPPNDRQLLIIVHLDKPIACGATGFLVRRERHRKFAAGDSGGQRSVGLGNLAQSPGRIDARGIQLPPHAAEVRYFPEAEATMFPGPPLTVTWVSADLNSGPTALGVTFAVR